MALHLKISKYIVCLKIAYKFDRGIEIIEMYVYFDLTIYLSSEIYNFINDFYTLESLATILQE